MFYFIIYFGIISITAGERVHKLKRWVPMYQPNPSTTTLQPTPESLMGCTLANDTEICYRFGGDNDSHIEYSTLPDLQLPVFDLTISLRTANRHGGLIFYAAADNDTTQFLAFFMKDAKLHFVFNCGGASGEISSRQTYNDSQWHLVTLTRSGAHGRLTVDSEVMGEVSVPCNNAASLAAPYYYGGLRDPSPPISTNLGGFYQPFQGYLMSLKMNGQLVTDVYRGNYLPFADSVVTGACFGDSTSLQSNYLKLIDNFNVGLEVSISMEIKPRNNTGLLVSVHGTKDYLVLELLKNEVIATINNGDGAFRAVYTLANELTLCDGNWHKIHVLKSLYVVSVGVDGHFSKPGMGTSTASMTDTSSALYIGGHIRPLHEVKGVESNVGFTGCIKNILIQESPVKISPTAAGRNTHIVTCPRH